MSAKETHRPIILVDTREQQPWIFYDSDKINGSKKQKLDTGDYTIDGMEHLLVVERKKSPSELYVNFGVESKRFWAELDRMKKFKYKFLFMEFMPEDIYEYPVIARRMGRECRLSPDFIFSRITKLQIEYDIHCVFLGDINDNKKRHKIKAYILKFFHKIYNMYREGKLDGDAGEQKIQQ
jgi:hypothetical protein